MEGDGIRKKRSLDKILDIEIRYTLRDSNKDSREEICLSWSDTGWTFKTVSFFTTVPCLLAAKQIKKIQLNCTEQKPDRGAETTYL